MHPESMGYDSRKSGTREHHRSTVKKVVEFGVFIELVPGMEGLLHISEMTRRQYETLKASASKSGPIQVVVLDVNMNKKTNRAEHVAVDQTPVRNLGWNRRALRAWKVASGNRGRI